MKLILYLMKNLSNISEFTVSDLTNSIKKIVEGTFDLIKVSGEISQVKQHTSGHIYFTLKDEDNSISGICWRSNVPKLKVNIEEGSSVIILGRVTTYSPQSKYQVIVDDIEYQGEGQLLKILEDRKKKLADEGLFDKKYKKILPTIPTRIGVITSESGSVLHDIVHRINDRYPIEIILFSSKVQGEGTSNEIISGLDFFNNSQSDDLLVDLIIIARGGGSLEDLMPFNDEKLVRKIFESSIPIVSAIGHETDITLCDFVSDLRAPTPTAAAEIVLPDRKEILIRLNDKIKIIKNNFDENLKEKLLNVEILNSKFPNFYHKINELFQNTDYLGKNISSFLEKIISNFRLSFYELANKFESLNIQNNINVYSEKLKNQNILLKKNFDQFKILKQGFLENKIKQLNILSYKNTLKRGYSVVRYNNVIIDDDNSIKKGDKIIIEFHKNKTQAKKI